MMNKLVVIFASVLLISSVSYSSETSKKLNFQEKPDIQTATSRLPRSPRISIRFGYGAGLLKENKSISWTQEVYQENATYSVDYDARKGNSLSLGIGYKLSNAVGIDLGLDIASRSLIAGNGASIPHPLYFNSPREAESSKNHKIKENAVFLNLVYSIPFGKLELDLYAGPAYFNTSTELTSAITYTESIYPYSSVSISTQSEKLKKNGFGFNVGSSLNFYMSKSFAVYVSARYLSAKANFLPTSGIPELSLTLGGFKVGGGLKIIF